MVVPNGWQPHEADRLVFPFLERFKGATFVSGSPHVQAKYSVILDRLITLQTTLSDEKDWATSTGNLQGDCVNDETESVENKYLRCGADIIQDLANFTALLLAETEPARDAEFFPEGVQQSRHTHQTPLCSKR